MWWSRERFKGKAKHVLSSSYWIAFLVCLIFGLLAGGLGSFPAARHNYVTHGWTNNTVGPTGTLTPFFSTLIILVILVAVAVGLVVAAIALAYAFFVISPLSVGKKRYFLLNRKGFGEVSVLFSTFRAHEYINVVKAMAWRWLMTFLWTLCLIVPGIIKAYAYCLVPYILADNPQLSYRQALNMSEAMTNGSKFDIFVLQLSFLGWFILGALACFVGTLFVMPYYEATFAEMYGALRKKAVETGIVRAEELNLGEADYAADC